MRRILSAFVMVIAISSLMTSDMDDYYARKSNYRKEHGAISSDNKFLNMKYEEQMEELRYKHMKAQEEIEFKKHRAPIPGFEEIAVKSKLMRTESHGASSYKPTKEGSHYASSSKPIQARLQHTSSLTNVKQESQCAQLPPISQVELDRTRYSKTEKANKLPMEKSSYSEKPKSQYIEQIAQSHLARTKSHKMKEPTNDENSSLRRKKSEREIRDSASTIPKSAVRNRSFEDQGNTTKEAEVLNIETSSSQLSRSTSNSERGLPRREDNKSTSKCSDDLTIEQRKKKKENQRKYYNPDSSDMKLSSLLSHDSSQSYENERLDIWEERSPSQELPSSSRRRTSSRSITSIDKSASNRESHRKNREIIQRVGSMKMGKPKTPHYPGLVASKTNESENNDANTIVFHPTCKNMFQYANDDVDTWMKISCSHSPKDAEEMFLKKGKKLNFCVPIFCMSKHKPIHYNETKDNAFPHEYTQREVLCQILLRSDHFIKKGFKYPRKKFHTLSYLAISSETVTITGRPHKTIIDGVRVMSCPYVLDFDHHNMYQFYVSATKSSNKYFVFLEDDDTFKVEAFIKLERMRIPFEEHSNVSSMSRATTSSFNSVTGPSSFQPNTERQSQDKRKCEGKPPIYPTKIGTSKKVDSQSSNICNSTNAPVGNLKNLNSPRNDLGTRSKMNNYAKRKDLPKLQELPPLKIGSKRVRVRRCDSFQYRKPRKVEFTVPFSPIRALAKRQNFQLDEKEFHKLQREDVQISHAPVFLDESKSQIPKLEEKQPIKRVENKGENIADLELSQMNTRDEKKNDKEARSSSRKEPIGKINNEKDLKGRGKKVPAKGNDDGKINNVAIAKGRKDPNRKVMLEKLRHSENKMSAAGKEQLAVGENMKLSDHYQTEYNKDGAVKTPRNKNVDWKNSKKNYHPGVVRMPQDTNLEEQYSKNNNQRGTVRTLQDKNLEEKNAKNSHQPGAVKTLQDKHLEGINSKTNQQSSNVKIHQDKNLEGKNAKNSHRPGAVKTLQDKHLEGINLKTNQQSSNVKILQDKYLEGKNAKNNHQPGAVKTLQDNYLEGINSKTNQQSSNVRTLRDKNSEGRNSKNYHQPENMSMKNKILGQKENISNTNENHKTDNNHNTSTCNKKEPLRNQEKNLNNQRGTSQPTKRKEQSSTNYERERLAKNEINLNKERGNNPPRENKEKSFANYGNERLAPEEKPASRDTNSNSRQGQNQRAEHKEKISINYEKKCLASEDKNLNNRRSVDRPTNITADKKASKDKVKDRDNKPLESIAKSKGKEIPIENVKNNQRFVSENKVCGEGNKYKGNPVSFDEKNGGQRSSKNKISNIGSNERKRSIVNVVDGERKNQNVGRVEVKKPKITDTIDNLTQTKITSKDKKFNVIKSRSLDGDIDKEKRDPAMRKGSPEEELRRKRINDQFEYNVKKNREKIKDINSKETLKSKTTQRAEAGIKISSSPKSMKPSEPKSHTGSASNKKNLSNETSIKKSDANKNKPPSDIGNSGSGRKGSSKMRTLKTSGSPRKKSTGTSKDIKNSNEIKDTGRKNVLKKEGNKNNNEGEVTSKFKPLPSPKARDRDDRMDYESSGSNCVSTHTRSSIKKNIRIDEKRSASNSTKSKSDQNISSDKTNGTSKHSKCTDKSATNLNLSASEKGKGKLDNSDISFPKKNSKGTNEAGSSLESTKDGSIKMRYDSEGTSGSQEYTEVFDDEVVYANSNERCELSDEIEGISEDTRSETRNIDPDKWDKRVQPGNAEIYKIWTERGDEQLWQLVLFYVTKPRIEREFAVYKEEYSKFFNKLKKVWKNIVIKSPRRRTRHKACQLLLKTEYFRNIGYKYPDMEGPGIYESLINFYAKHHKVRDFQIALKYVPVKVASHRVFACPYMRKGSQEIFYFFVNKGITPNDYFVFSQVNDNTLQLELYARFKLTKEIEDSKDIIQDDYFRKAF